MFTTENHLQGRARVCCHYAAGDKEDQNHAHEQLVTVTIRANAIGRVTRRVSCTGLVQIW